MVELRILGTVNLVGAGGRELRSVLAQPKRVALLAYLAAATSRRFHRRDSLVALFWPELDQEHARAALRQALHGLRRSLGDGALESRGDDEVGLDGNSFWCDAAAFESAVDAGRHADALELYRGDLLEGFFISGAPEFEHWLEDERARLRRRAGEAGWTLAESCRRAGDASLAAHWARRGAALARDDESVLRRLVALLGDLGDRAGAVQAYETFARRLAAEYEVEPAPETKALIAAIRAHEAAPIGEPWRPPLENENPRVIGEPAPLPELAAPPEADISRDADLVPARGRRRRVPAIGVAVAFVALTLGAVVIWGPPAMSRPRPGTTSLDSTRVVVAPFSNRTGDSTLDAVGELAAEEITRGLELTEVVELADPGVATLPRGRVARYSNPAGQEAAAARTLALATGSGLAVWGAAYRQADRIEVVAHIVDERGGKILRALEPVPIDPLHPRPALVTLRDQVMAVVAEAVDPRLGASASAAGNPPRYDAYLAFSTGVGIWYDGRNGRDALPHFKQAASLDSTFALPLIWAAWVHQTLNECDSTEAIARRLSALRLSRLEQMQIDRQINRCRGDLPAAYRLAHALADARPGSEVWQEQLARDALNFNRPREAVEILERLHPERGALRGRTSYYNWLTNAYHLLGQHERELQAAERARARFPGNLAALRMELMALAALGRGRDVAQRLDDIDPLPPDPIRKKATVMREIALDLAAHGDSGAARIALGRALAWHANRPAAEKATEHLRFERAQTLYAAGRGDSARAIVEDLRRAHPSEEQYAGLLGVLAAQRGDRAAAVTMDRMLDGRERRHGRGQATYWRACIAARLGHRDDAVHLLKRALAEGFVFNALFFMSAHVEPSFATLRSDPRFQQLLRPTG
jgi:DNA-binding SARP family transcriptional activator/TolB-like protein